MCVSLSLLEYTDPNDAPPPNHLVSFWEPIRTLTICWLSCLTWFLFRQKNLDLPLNYCCFYPPPSHIFFLTPTLFHWCTIVVSFFASRANDKWTGVVIELLVVQHYNFIFWALTFLDLSNEWQNGKNPGDTFRSKKKFPLTNNGFLERINLL